MPVVVGGVAVQRGCRAVDSGVDSRVYSLFLCLGVPGTPIACRHMRMRGPLPTLVDARAPLLPSIKMETTPANPPFRTPPQQLKRPGDSSIEGRLAQINAQTADSMRM